MEEKMDVLDFKNGKKTGEIVLKDFAHTYGIWHGSVHLIIISNDKKRILLQKRCSLKKLFPNMWDISVGGHVSSLESSIDSIKRELGEELGLSLDKLDIKLIKRIKEIFKNGDIDSREFVDVYLTFADVDLKDVVLQEDEVSEVCWFTKQELNDLIQNKKIVSHNEEFKIINEILVN